MMSSRISRNSSVGKPCGISWMLSLIRFLIDSKPVHVSMLVYMEVTLAEKSLAVLGIGISLISWMTEKEFFS